MATKKTQPWQGTDYVERKLNHVHNKLVQIILAETPRGMPSPWPRGTMGLPHPLDPEKAVADIKEAVETHKWLLAQKTPASVRGWAERELKSLERNINEAQAALLKIVEGGRFASEQEAIAKEKGGKHPYGVRIGNLWYDVRADDPDDAVKKVKTSFARRGVPLPPGNISVSEFAENRR
jgi:hypothetical protein